MRIKRGFYNRAPYWDNIDWYTLFVLIVVVAAGGLRFIIPSTSSPTPTYSLVLLTAGSVLYAHYQLRHYNEATVPAVRPEYKNPYSTDETGYGLKNYGPGPALYLQIKAKIPGSDEKFLLCPHDQPTHLEEGRFLSLTDHDQLGNNKTIPELIEGKEGDSKIQFYYSYVSRDGIREPLEAKRLTEQDDENILSKLPVSEGARSIKIERVRQHLGIEEQNRHQEAYIDG